jgi:hypothetical protein
LKGAAQPFSVRNADRIIEMTGRIPVYKLHGSLNWSGNEDKLTMYQDMRAAFRNGGDAAIIPPIPEKEVPRWLTAVWNEAEVALRWSDVWVVCGYSAPEYDQAVRNLLRNGSGERPLKIFLLSPDSNFLTSRWSDIAPAADVFPLDGLPKGVEALAEALGKIS